jgi:nucleotide-binding universal stress UspA family protein
MIKKILLATDFSENSKVAAQYAVQLAQKIKAELILFHTYYIQTTSVEFVEFIDIHEFNLIRNEQLNSLKMSIEQDGLNITTDVTIGLSATDEITEAVRRHDADLLILGLKGTTFLESLFIGSTALSLFTHSPVPVLAIPSSAHFSEIKNIAFAYDGEDVESSKNIQFLSDFTTDLNAELFAFTVLNKEQQEEFNESVKGIILKNLLGGIKHNYQLVSNENVQDGIHEFVARSSADILAFVPRKHSFFQRIFVGSKTQEFAKQSHIPLLILPNE